MAQDLGINERTLDNRVAKDRVPVPAPARFPEDEWAELTRLPQENSHPR